MRAAERLVAWSLVLVTAAAGTALLTVQKTEEASTATAAVAAASFSRSLGEPSHVAAARVAVLAPAVVRVSRPAAPSKPTGSATAAARPVATSKPRPKPAVSAAALFRTGCDGGRGWVQRRGAYALSTLTYDWKPLGYDIVFLPGRRGITGMTYMRAKRIEVYIRSCSRMSLAYLAETIAHEIGHAIDFSRGTDAWHRQWQVARHISLSVPWYGANGASDFDTPAGDFAETFAAWQVPGGPDGSHWGRPSHAALLALVPLMTI